jgi:hypothetical protein
MSLRDEWSPWPRVGFSRHPYPGPGFQSGATSRDRLPNQNGNHHKPAGTRVEPEPPWPASAT